MTHPCRASGDLLLRVLQGHCVFMHVVWNHHHLEGTQDKNKLMKNCCWIITGLILHVWTFYQCLLFSFMMVTFISLCDSHVFLLYQVTTIRRWSLTLTGYFLKFWKSLHSFPVVWSVLWNSHNIPLGLVSVKKKTVKWKLSLSRFTHYPREYTVYLENTLCMPQHVQCPLFTLQTCRCADDPSVRSSNQSKWRGTIQGLSLSDNLDVHLSDVLF